MQVKYVLFSNPVHLPGRAKISNFPEYNKKQKQATCLIRNPQVCLSSLFCAQEFWSLFLFTVIFMAPFLWISISCIGRFISNPLVFVFAIWELVGPQNVASDQALQHISLPWVVALDVSNYMTTYRDLIAAYIQPGTPVSFNHICDFLQNKGLLMIVIKHFPAQSCLKQNLVGTEPFEFSLHY